LIETMEENEKSYNNYKGVNLLDIRTEQPSLISNDFALAMTFYCSSGVYSGSSMEKVAVTRTVRALAATLAAVLTVLAMAEHIYCKQPLNANRGALLVDDEVTAVCDHRVV
jgi:hypothetical protein